VHVSKRSLWEGLDSVVFSSVSLADARKNSESRVFDVCNALHLCGGADSCRSKQLLDSLRDREDSAVVPLLRRHIISQLEVRGKSQPTGFFTRKCSRTASLASTAALAAGCLSLLFGVSP
jgi:hypothetical protein